MSDARPKPAAIRRSHPAGHVEPSAGARFETFGQKNLILLLVALVVIVVGHVVLGMGSITLAPILLVLGYCVLVPLAIIL